MKKKWKTIKTDSSKIEFYRNGRSLGVAFADFPSKCKNGAYFPAASLTKGEKVEFNFGNKPFLYPVEGYLPIQLENPNQENAHQLLKFIDSYLKHSKVN